ncbi:hypothetical protein ACU686_42790 [Yinghuangia aomiensis]
MIRRVKDPACSAVLHGEERQEFRTLLERGTPRPHPPREFRLRTLGEEDYRVPARHPRPAARVGVRNPAPRGRRPGGSAGCPSDARPSPAAGGARCEVGG